MISESDTNYKGLIYDSRSKSACWAGRFNLIVRPPPAKTAPLAAQNYNETISWEIVDSQKQITHAACSAACASQNHFSTLRALMSSMRSVQLFSCAQRFLQTAAEILRAQSLEGGHTSSRQKKTIRARFIFGTDAMEVRKINGQVAQSGLTDLQQNY